MPCGRTGLHVRLFGGWAEEIARLTPPRKHHDVDLLLLAGDFQRLDRVIADRQLPEIQAKRMVHKRAIEEPGVMVSSSWYVRMPAGFHGLLRPAVDVAGGRVDVASN